MREAAAEGLSSPEEIARAALDREVSQGPKQRRPPGDRELQSPEDQPDNEGEQGQKGPAAASPDEAVLQRSIATQASLGTDPSQLPRNPNQPDLADRNSWRTSFDAFLNHLSATKNADGDWILDWGDLDDLKFLADSAAATESLKRGTLSEEEAQVFLGRSGGVAERLGEVTWKARLTTPPLGPGCEVIIDLADPPEPFEIEFQLKEEDAGNWSQFDTGAIIHFIGRFDTFRGGLQQPVITMRIRLPDELTQSRTDAAFWLFAPSHACFSDHTNANRSDGLVIAKPGRFITCV